MKIEQEDKVALAAKRAELVQISLSPLPPEERVRIQGELSVINAKIKALNTTSAAQLKAAADRRKVQGLAQAQADAARARAKINSVLLPDDEPEDDDPGQTEAIDGWIDAVLMRNDVEFVRSSDGTLTLDCAPKWAAVLATLIDGLNAAARGQELPDLPRPPAKPTKPPAKPKKR